MQQNKLDILIYFISKHLKSNSYINRYKIEYWSTQLAIKPENISNSSTSQIYLESIEIISELRHYDILLSHSENNTLSYIYYK